MFSNAQSIASKGLEFDRNIPDSAEMIADKIDEKISPDFIAHFHHVTPPGNRPKIAQNRVYEC